MKDKIVKTIKKDGESENEVLAIGYQNEMLIGFLSGTECESASEILGEVTAYIELKDLEQIFLQ